MITLNGYSGAGYDSPFRFRCCVSYCLLLFLMREINQLYQCHIFNLRIAYRVGLIYGKLAYEEGQYESSFAAIIHVTANWKVYEKQPHFPGSSSALKTR